MRAPREPRPLPPLRFGVTRAILRDGADGVRYLRAEPPLQDHAAASRTASCTGAEKHPTASSWPAASAMPTAAPATGSPSAGARRCSARSIAQALLDRGLRPSGRSRSSARTARARAAGTGRALCRHPHCPVSPAYSLVSQDFDKLRHVLATLTPGLVFAPDARYARAVQATVGTDVEVVLGEGRIDGRETTPLAQLLATQPTPAVDAAMQATGRTRSPSSCSPPAPPSCPRR